MKARQSILLRYMSAVWRRWRDNITPAGKCLVGAVFVAGLGSVSVVVPIYQVFCALAALLGVAEVVGFIFRPNVAYSGSLPAKTSVGEPVTAEMTLTNRAHRPIYDLSLGIFELPPEIRVVGEPETVLSLPRNGSVALSITLESSRRGLYELSGLRAFSTFPFNLVRSGWKQHSLGTLLVLPEFHPLEAIKVPIGSRYQPGGVAFTSHIGESPEYIGSREYVAGEPIRRLDYRSWARLGQPVVREFQEEYYCRIALILDTYIPPGRKSRVAGFPNLEAAVSLAASVADALSGGEHLIDIFAAGPELFVFRAGRHTAHFENVLEVLACVDACRHDPFDTIRPALIEELGNISTAICIFLDWDESRRQLARTILESGCQLKVLIVNDGETTLPTDAPEFDTITKLTTDDILAGGLEIE